MRHCYIAASAFLCVAGFSVLSPVANAQDKKEKVEFHGYARLGTVGDINPLNPATTEQGYGQFGLYTSRHVRDFNYLRLQTIANVNDDMKFNVETQLDGALPHQKGNWAGATVNIRNAYLETALADKTSKLWFGARRMEYEDLRLFDAFPLSATTFYGAGAEYNVMGTGSTTAIGAQDRTVTVPSGTSTTGTISAPAKDITLFQRFDVKLGDNAALRPTLIVTHKSEAKTPTATIEKTSTDFKVGTVLSTWGNSGYNNGFVWVESNKAAGSGDVADKDYNLGVATSGDFEGLKDANAGFMYGAVVEYKMFNKDQQKFKLTDGAMVVDGTNTGKSNIKLALDVQPVYYVTDKFHTALDFNYSMQTKVGDNTPNVFLVTPILRYAASKTALGTPQLFASFTYGKYEAKVKTDVKGKATDSLMTTQAGMEVWF